MKSIVYNLWKQSFVYGKTVLVARLDPLVLRYNITVLKCMESGCISCFSKFCEVSLEGILRTLKNTMEFTFNLMGDSMRSQF